MIDAECLREADPRNVERLARALNVRLPAQKRDKAYTRTLIRLVLRAIEAQQASHAPSSQPS